MLTMILAVGCDNDCVATLLMSCKSCGNWRACRPSHSWEVGPNAWDEGEGVRWGLGDVINKRKTFSSHHSGHLIVWIFTQPGAKATNPAVMG